MPEDHFTIQLRMVLAINKKVLRDIRRRLDQDQNHWTINRDELEKIEFQLKAMGLLTATAGDTVISITKQLDKLPSLSTETD